jgi:hypothetical protein
MKLPIGLTVFLGLAAGGCEEKTTPLPPSTNPAPPGVVARPTTQEILQSPKKTVQLANYPLQLDVPEFWEAKMIKAGAFVHGPSPGGSVAMLVTRWADDTGDPESPRRFSSEEIDRSFKRDLDARQREPQRVLLAARRQLGDPPDYATLIETQEIEPAIPATRTADGEDRRAIPAMVTWTLRVYASDSGRFICHTIRLGIPLAQFEQDRAFLEGVFTTLRYDPALPKDKRDR